MYGWFLLFRVSLTRFLIRVTGRRHRSSNFGGDISARALDITFGPIPIYSKEDERISGKAP